MKLQQCFRHASTITADYISEINTFTLEDVYLYSNPSFAYFVYIAGYDTAINTHYSYSYNEYYYYKK